MNEQAAKPDRMPLVATEILRRLRPELDPERTRWLPIRRGGSDRRFYRICLPAGASVVAMHYDDATEENRCYVPVALFLHRLGVRVPLILAHDAVSRWVVMEDAGSSDLYALRTRSWERRRRHYEAVLAMVARLHGCDERDPSVAAVPMMAGYTADLYGWEWEYFLRNFIETCCGGVLTAAEERRLTASWQPLAERLLAVPRRLIHRDLQSQNIMIDGSSPILIDFQGLRWGNPFYDLGSLLCDPYVPMTESQRGELLRFSFLQRDQGLSLEAFQRAFLEASAQRLFQALGAYGFLGLRKGKKAFLKHLPRGVDRLRQALERLSGWDDLLERLDRYAFPGW